MKEKIKKICQKIEKEKNVQILFAVENGSRAWRISSEDSDYDIRFVFVRSLKEYIQINKPADVINIFFDKSLNLCSPENAFVDFSGFDVFKFVKMLSSSNPTTIEWLVSDIIYYGSRNKVFKEFAIKNFSKISSYHHYKSMCRNNYLKYLKSGSDITYKRYLYSFRGLINAKWVAHFKTVPPIDFNEALNESRVLMPKPIFDKLHDIIKLKLIGREKDIVQNIVKMDNYIESFLKDDSEAPTDKVHATLNMLNDELRKITLKNK
ncbi:nucleotidyltransferase domain-containing protein [Candidatus Woesearchaeota archaeon]|nr:nucleotidyltransferase domain-containing protein [Candidatus Woesearchaeota archaeon]